MILKISKSEWKKRIIQIKRKKLGTKNSNALANRDNIAKYMIGA